MNALWHVGNVVLCLMIGVLLFALIPNLIPFGSGTTDLFGFLFAYTPFFIERAVFLLMFLLRYHLLKEIISSTGWLLLV